MTNGINDIPVLIEALRQGNEQLANMAKTFDSAWDLGQKEKDPRRLHNMYAKNLIACYASKFSDLTAGLLDAIGQDNYLVYALCGRGLLETTATLRYYIFHKYKPLLDKGSLTQTEMRDLVDIDDRHLRGTRFDWESYLFQNYAKLKHKAVEELKSNKSKSKNKKGTESTKPMTQEQVNVMTCIKHWANETPEVYIGYSLFCDLVHPNLGSTFLVASASKGQIFFSRLRGEQPIGRQIMEQSLPLLLSITRDIGPLLAALMGTIWNEDEL